MVALKETEKYEKKTIKNETKTLLRERLRRGINFFEHETNHLWVRDSGQGNDRLLALSTTSLPLFVRVC